MISIMMIMMLIILAREHNRVAAELAKMHPAWNDDKLYSEVYAHGAQSQGGRSCAGARVVNCPTRQSLSLITGSLH